MSIDKGYYSDNNSRTTSRRTPRETRGRIESFERFWANKAAADAADKVRRSKEMSIDKGYYSDNNSRTTSRRTPRETRGRIESFERFWANKAAADKVRRSNADASIAAGVRRDTEIRNACKATYNENKTEFGEIISAKIAALPGRLQKDLIKEERVFNKELVDLEQIYNTQTQNFKDVEKRLKSLYQCHKREDELPEIENYIEKNLANLLKDFEKQKSDIEKKREKFENQFLRSHKEELRFANTKHEFAIRSMLQEEEEPSSIALSAYEALYNMLPQSIQNILPQSIQNILNQ